MKKLLLVSIVTFLISMSSNQSFAEKITEEASGSNYAVVNVMYVMSHSKAVQSITKQVMAYKEKLDKLAQIKQDELQQNQQDILSKQNEMSPKDFESAKKQFQIKVQDSQQELYEKTNKLEKVRDEALSVIEKSISSIINDIADTYNYELVFQATSLARYPTNRDISKEVVDKLNKKTPSVNVKKPF